jgi:DNA-directed RNA polymerase subunit beta'
LGIQAFEPVLVEGKAIQLHPLVCGAFNADFDGDQMAVHVPLSRKSIEEARRLMISTGNLLKPSDGEPVVSPTKDMVLGVYYLTMTEPTELKGNNRAFSDLNEIELAYALGQINIHANIRLLCNTYYDDKGIRYADGQPVKRIVKTTVGRALFNRIVPEKMQFYNKTLDKGEVQKLVGMTVQVLGEEGNPDVIKFLDDIKAIGFKYATRSGVSIAISDITVPEIKNSMLEAADIEVRKIERQFRRGLMTEDERESRTIDIWSKTRDDVAAEVKRNMDPVGNLSVMAVSGATKGGFGPIAQLAGMRGMMADPSGRIIALPIRSNFREGLDALEFFISTHGQRKGLADTAMRTADAGYLTRRLCDVAQDVIINIHDCGTMSGLWMRTSDDVGGQKLRERIFGRVLAADVMHPETGAIIAERGQMIDEHINDMIANAKVQEVYVRSPMTCELETGLCQLCYGRDLGRGKLVAIGAATGIIASQSIGEPGTQLTLRTFHTGGVAAQASDITQGLPRVEELLEARKKPKAEALMSDISGKVHVERLEGGIRHIEITDSQLQRDEYQIPGGWELKVRENSDVKDKDVIATKGDQMLHCEHGGRVVIDGLTVAIIYEKREQVEYEVPPAARLLVTEGQIINAGDPLTEGTKNPHMMLKVLGRDAAQNYLLSEVQKVYRSQGVNINDKHFEIVIRKMMNRVQITSPGDSNYLPGDLVNRLELARVNEDLATNGRRPATGQPVLLGISKAALATDSFLSASSFQHTIKVLASAAIEGKRDDLVGLKENVILGKLIPAGTGSRIDGVIEFEGVTLPAFETPQKPSLIQEAEMKMMGVNSDGSPMVPEQTLPDALMSNPLMKDIQELPANNEFDSMPPIS